MIIVEHDRRSSSLSSLYRLAPLPSDTASLVLLCSLYLRGVMAPLVWIIYDRSVQIDVPNITIHQTVLQRPKQVRYSHTVHYIVRRDTPDQLIRLII